jgi:hypothetical protein
MQGASELEALRVGNYTAIFMSYNNDHDLHCLYTWRKVAIALERNVGWVDSRSLEFLHCTHCARNISQLLEAKSDLVS